LDYPPFKAAFGLKNTHLQTLFPAIVRKIIRPQIEIEQFELADGDFVECYWHGKPPENSSMPIVILFHGLEGSFKSPYVQGMMVSLEQAGFSTVLMHFRGCSGKPNRLPRSYHSGDTADAKAWIATVHQRYPTNPLFAIGYSLGGNMLLKLLGEWGNNAPIKAAVSVSAPLQLDKCAEHMESGFSRFYQYLLIKHLKHSLLKKFQQHAMQALINIKQQQVKKLVTFSEFDDAYTAPIHGFKSATDYYCQSSAKQYLKMIRIPTLIIHALDDPFMTPDVVPKADELSSIITLDLSMNGGHLGFIGGYFFKPDYWLEGRIIHYFNNDLPIK
jgi:predicted alpha/beta-fold hydrolase